jgi:uncharacterized membrane protein HdeD (DUF308 family)
MAKSGARSGVKSVIKDGGYGQLIWSISVALYLIANGVLGVTKNPNGDFHIIFSFIFNGSSFGNMVAMLVSVISLLAGILVLFELFKVKFSFLDELLFIVAIIWVVYIVIEIFYWLKNGRFGSDLWGTIQKLAVHLMVLGSLFIASKKFGK